jgi:hypothetical protein
MRHARQNPHEVRDKGVKSRSFIQEHFSMEKVGNLLAGEFRRILETLTLTSTAIDKEL